MTLDPAQFARNRARAASVIRWTALFLFVSGLVAAGTVWVVRVRGYANWPPLFLVAVPALVMLAGFWIPAIILALGAHRLARWLVPAPPREPVCPGCGYPASGGGPCPECGRELAGDSAGS